MIELSGYQDSNLGWPLLPIMLKRQNPVTR